MDSSGPCGLALKVTSQPHKGVAIITYCEGLYAGKANPEISSFTSGAEQKKIEYSMNSPWSHLTPWLMKMAFYLHRPPIQGNLFSRWSAQANESKVIHAQMARNFVIGREVGGRLRHVQLSAQQRNSA